MKQKNIQDIYPLSPLQAGLLFQALYAPTSDAYFVQSIVEIEGKLDHHRLQKAWQTLMDHHPILRTGVLWDGLDNPLQYVLSSLSVPFTYLDWTKQDTKEAHQEKQTKSLEERLEDFIQADRRQGFDLSKAPLFRVTLIKTHKECYTLLWSQHHILTDGWSLPIVMNDLFNTYQGKSITVPRRPYKDYIAWLQRQDMDKAEAFWKDTLKGLDGPTRLPFKGIIEENQEKDYDYHPFTLSLEETNHLKSFAQKHGLTLNTLFQGAVGKVLQTYTQNPDVVLGINLSGRAIDLSGVEDMVGLFINTLPLRIPSAKTTPLDFLKQLQEQTQHLNEYDYTPLAQIQSWTGESKGLFDVVLAFENYPLQDNTLNEKADFIIKWGGAIEKSEYPLTIAVGPSKELSVHLSYQTEYFDQAQVIRLEEHIRRALEGLTREDETLVYLLPLLSASEEEQLLLTWNDTTKDYPREKTIHQLFEEQVQKTPHNIAVVYEDESLTYKALNEKANQLAHLLRAQGVGPDTLVAIAMDRSLEMIIGLLGILKAGGAYVPLDPEYPSDRLQFMLEDTNVPFIITDTKNINKLPSTWAQLICLDDQNTPINQYSTTNLTPLATPLNLAYIIYTSGSTGKPKGVEVKNSSLVNLVLSQNHIFSINQHSRLLQFASLSFDASSSEIFTTLSQGGSLFLINREYIKDSASLLQNIIRNKITVSTLPPSFLEHLDQENLSEISTLIVAGEPPSQQLVSKCLTFEKTLINAYGPTENTVCATTFLCKINYAASIIGKPIANAEIYILDGEMQPVPIGVRGEIYIGGEGLARGYLNRPELTAERFVPNPFAGKYIDLENALPSDTEPSLSSLRLYKTGDIARYLPDGNIEFLGRSDDQVKIRGFRIECGEIQTALSAHGEVASSLIIPREDEQGHKRLIAYVIPKNMDSFKEESVLTSSTGESFKRLIDTREGNSFTEELRTHLTTSLPDYMIPAFFVLVDRFPLTPNGKIDKASLPDPDLSLREETFVAPRTKIEEDLSHIWSEVLGISPISIHDNFFRIGGHSLLATQVISRIRQVFSRDIPIRAIFDAPTIKDLALHISQTQTSELPPILPVERPEHIPLSFAQERLWFLDQFLPNSPLYNIPVALKLKGDLNRDALEKSFNILIDRHESLRTIFKEENGIPAQVILSPFSISLSPVDYSTSENPQTEVMAVAQEEASTPFVLSQGPLLRVRLLRLGEKDHILLLTCHHIIFDGWSSEIFFKELSASYNAYAEGKEPLSPSLPIQYADFALWQRNWLQGDILEQQLSYWKQQLAGTPDLLELPTDKPRPKELTYRGASYHTTLSKELQEQLHALAQANQTSLFMTLLAIFQVLLTRYTGEKDIVVGSPIAGRQYKEIEGLLGFFVNTLALRITFEGHETFIDVLNKVKEITLQAYQHQDVPFEQLVDHLNIPREFNRNPIFQTIFTFQNAKKKEAIGLKNLSVDSIVSFYSVARFDLSFDTYEDETGVGISINYATDLFEEETIERISVHFKELVSSILRDPFQSIHSYSLLTQQEERQILIEWNDTKTDYSANKSIHQLFEDQATKTPHNIAVIYEGEELSYQQLNERANQLAHYLKKLGVGPDTLVAIAVEKSLEMVIGLLGILKAGGAYVPLDPTYPQERLQFMLEDTNAPVLLTQLSLKEIFRGYPGVIVFLNPTDDIFQQELKDNLPPLTSPHHLAYVIYTSGSTGKPKGVMIEHENLTNYINYSQKTYRTSNGVSLLHSSIAFDLSITSIFLPFMVGNSILVLSRDSQVDSLGKILNDPLNNLSFLKVTPTHLKILKEQFNTELAHKQRGSLIIGGENLLKNDIEFWLESTSHTSFFNEYGPTEATVGSCVFELKDNSTLFSGSVPIGHPIFNTQVYILDKYLNPVPIGVRGEIYIGGVGLARGYLNRPDLTADRFTPNPFIQKEGEENQHLRLYRTGDLARYLSDGNIEFLGRIDDQVKIRGFRIELGEIESTLNAHGDVAQTVVMVKKDETGDKQLVAYVVPGEFTPLDTELKDFLLEKLPDYMVPPFFVYLDKIPLTPNGKIDKASLPDPDLSLREETFVAPRTKIEEDLSHIWSEVLGISPISIHDNFFNIGGHSLLATQVISRIRQVFSRDIPIRAIFDAPTIKDLALHISQTQTSELPPILPVERPEHIPLSFAQERLWFLDQFLPNSPLYNIPVALKLKGDLNRDALEKSFNILIDRHESLRTIFKEENGIPAQVILSPFSISLSPVDYSTSENPQTEVMAVAQEEASTPFVLSQGPLLRVRLLRLGEKDHILLLTCHHIIFDGWSSEIFFKELSASYNAYAEGKEPLSPSLPIQYADFALWQRNWLQGDILEQQLSYWKQQLAGTPDLLELPTDKPRPKELTYRGASYHTTLSKELQEQLHALAQANQTSLFMTLLAIFQVLLTRYTGEKDIVVGSPIAGRQYKEIEGLLGFFVNTLAIRTIFKDQDTFHDALKQVRSSTLEAYAHQDLPFEQLVDHLKIERVTNRNPLFQVMFALQSVTTDETLSDLQISQLPLEHTISKFDLTLNALEQPEGISLAFEYATDLFEENTIKRMASHLEELIKGCVKDPSQSIQEVSLLKKEEKQQLLLTWNDTTKDYPREKTIHQLFEEQVQKTPHNIAVVYEDESLTYKALNEKANQLAHLLRAQGVGPDTLVAIAMDRSLEMIIGLLGILKAGGAYVPLDPDYPTDRLQFMLEDTNAPLFVTQSFLKDKLDPLLNSYQGSTLFLDQALNDDLNFFYENEADKTLVKDSTDLGCTQPLSSYPKQNPIPLSTPLNLAYIIYTSGSTGKPKGVLTYHHNVARLLSTTQPWFNFNNKDTWSFFHSFAFDFSIWEIWGALSYGCRVAIVSYEVSRSPDLFYNFLIKHKVTILNQTPSAFLQLIKHALVVEGNAVEKDSLYPLTALRFIIFGGEALHTDILSPYLQKVIGKDTRLINMYGITETTVHATYSPFSTNISNHHQSLIGKKLPDLNSYILDGEMQPVPIGVRGEIYIGGEGLARGYLNRPELTAERFVPNPFAGKYIDLENALPSDTEPSLSSLRLYKTGDIARYLPDGNIEFLGRSDDQVKIRGFRIECGEIQTALSAHGEVASSLIIPREDEQGHKRLIAYVIPKNMDSFKEESVLTSSTGESFKRLIDTREGNSFTEELRTHLTTSLPDYMIPAFFVLVDRFPLTPNGKIDKASLPDPDLSLREETFVAPRTKIEEDLSHIWSEVLGISPISIHDNFFRIGGHSLLATQVISRIRQVFSRDIPIRAIFDAPTIKDLALHISQTQTSELPPILPVERPEHIPLSFAQERLWFLDQFLPNSPLYNIPVALKLKGDLNRDALEKSFNILIDRHESLRTIFKEENGIPAQVILSPFSISLSPVDYSTSENPQTEVMAVAQEEASTPFVLSQGPLLRVRLLRLGEKDHILLLTCHHIIFDGWSSEIFFKELSASYNAYAEGKEPLSPSLPIQYADFALWQRNWLQGDILEQQLSYWKQQLAGTPDLLELPTDKPRPKELTYRGASYHTTLSKELQEQLHALAQANQTSLFMTLLAIFQVLLTRYTGEKDIVVGSPIAGRQYKEIEGLLGFFVNTLAIRTIFKDQDTFHDALKQVRSSTLEAYAHQDLPFEQLVDHLKIERVTNRNPLFQVMFALQSVTTDETLSDLQISQLPLEHTISKFDLTLNALEQPEGISLAFEYATDLFEENTIKRMASHLEELIKGCVKDPSQSIQEVSLLKKEEKQQLLLTWNDTTKDYPREKTIHQLFEEQVQKTPHNIAVVYEDESLTYKALNEKANQLAHLLRAQGVGPDTLVAIAMDRSLEMIIGLLGILKAGGAYVPLDPDYPTDRLQFMLEDTNAPLFVTQSFLKDKLDPLLNSYQGSTLFLDQALNDDLNFFYENEADKTLVKDSTDLGCTQPLSSYPKQNPIPLSTPLNLAYIIYTSGSTGKPKGVLTYHHNVARLLSTTQPWFNFNNKDTWSFFHSFAFDFSIWEIWGALSYGCRVAIVSYEVSRSPDLFYNFLIKHKVTILNQTPSAFLQLIKHALVVEGNAVEKDSLYPLTALRFIIFGGEALHTDILSPYLQKVIGKDTRLINMYGITETTVHATYSPFSTNISNHHQSLIGKKLPDLNSYILDGEMQPVPIGVRGEIYIGGEGLARGYLNRPELTAERFVPNPFAGKYIDLENALPSDTEPSLSSLRLYKTGDIARYLPDGNIEFLGRSDDQVKIRGFRIECGEIQTALSAHGEVASSLIIPREDEQGHKRLIAYVIPKNMDSFKEESVLTSSTGESFKRLIDTREGNSFTEELRTHLTTSLPDYMIPAFFVLVDRFPLTPNGKIDKASLPDPDLSLREETFVAPRTKIEEDLSHIWSEVLGISPISIHDNFFRIGGHSLLATQVISRIRQVFSRDIPIRAIFDAPTIKDLALHISQTQTSELPPILPVERPEHIPLSFAQGRLWFLDQFLPNSPLYNIPVALKLKGDLNRDALEKSFNILIDRHESLRTTFPPIEGEAHQVILPRLPVHLEKHTQDLTALKSQELSSLVEKLAREEATTPFNLSTGPLLRVRLLKLTQVEHVLLITMHHIISDAWSMDIFFKELSSLYNAYAEGIEPSLPSLPIQYADFALWQRNWLQGDILEQQLSYWKQQLAGIPDLLELPTDKPRPKELTYRGASYHYAFPKKLKDQLNDFAQEHQVSLFMTLLAAFQVLLYRYTGQRDIVVGSPIANRHHKEIEDIIGFFVNTLALRTIFLGHETFRDILNNVKETTLQAYQHQDIYFDQLVDHLNVSRELNRNPVFQVEFSLDSSSINMSASLNQLTTENLFIKNTFARFDLRVLGIETKEDLFLYIEYSQDLFDLLTIERLTVHFEELLKNILQDSSQRISELSLLPPKEQHQLLIEWNDTKAEYPADKSIHELFEAQVERTPNNIAVVYEDEELTYEQLNERANQLAHYLRNRGVRHDTLVAIAVERSLEMVIGLLGILKAGGAYVPLDPTYPQERLQFMLEDTQAPIVLTDKNTIDLIPPTLAQVICLDDEWGHIKTFSSSNLVSLIFPHNLAYVIYTSGSTGKPKGVMVNHGNLTHYLGHCQYHYALPKGHALFHSSTAFDMSITSLFLPLISGNSVLILAKEAQIDSLGTFLKEYSSSLSFIKVTPTHLKALKNQLDPRALKIQKTNLIVGGENLLKEDANFWLKVAPESILLNEYGPTETTVGCCVFKFEDYHELSMESVPIGRPISNTQIYILDSHLNPAPNGISGEICIGGSGLARGYLNRPNLTAERFIPNPFTTHGNESEPDTKQLRLYRTGDLARYLPDGNIEFLGRIDEQIKIRGFRIELGEIESTLKAHGGVAQVIVIAREDEPTDKKLVAYVVPTQIQISSLNSESTFTSSSGNSFSVLNGDSIIGLTEDLRSHLVRSLPEYMVPSFFVYVDQIPLTLNGKIDRKALPAPDLSLRKVGDEYAPPHTTMEHDLCEIWVEVLKIEKIGINDNFFRIGGDSIISIQLVAKARAKGIHFAVKDIFNNPTISALASVSKTQADTLTLKPDQGMVTGQVPLTPIQHWFFEQKLSDQNHYNQATLLLAREYLNLAFLIQACSLLLSHHDALRLRYTYNHHNEWKQEYLDIEDIPICTVVNLSSSLDNELPLHIEKECSFVQQNLDIIKGPVIKVVLFDCGPSRPQRIVIIIHHLIVDGVSWRILLDDLESIYSQLTMKEKPSLLPKTHSYQQWAKALHEYASSSEMQKEAAYWQRIEASTEALPVDFNDGPAALESMTGTIAIALTESETKDLLQRVPKAYRTQINDILLTALVLAIGDWTQKYSLTLALEGHGREDIIQDMDLSRTVGWFTSIFPVYLTLKNPNDLGEAIKIVKEEVRQIPHKGVGYGIFKYLTKIPSLSSLHPSLSFNYLGQWDNIISQEGMFSFAHESTGQSISDRNKYSHLLNVNSAIREGVLQLFWTYSKNHYLDQTIENLAHNFINRLKQLIEHCSQDSVSGYTSSDFDLIQIHTIEDELNYIFEN